jgi:hypothetical protein
VSGSQGKSKGEGRRAKGEGRRTKDEGSSLSLAEDRESLPGRFVGLAIYQAINRTYAHLVPASAADNARGEGQGKAEGPGLGRP